MLVVVIMLTAAPLSGFVGLELPEWFNTSVNANAASKTETEIYENTELISGNNGVTNRIEWLHNLTVLFEMSVSSDNVPDNYFMDLDSDSEYYRDAMIAVEFGLIDIPAGGDLNPTGKVTREFAAHTLNYCLGFVYDSDTYSFNDVDDVEYDDDVQIAIDRGWFILEDNNFNPNYDVTAAEFAIMIKDAQEIIESSKINYDIEDSVVFKDGVVVVPKDIYVEINDTELVILDCPVAISTGDVVAVYPCEIPKVFLVLDMETSGDITILTVEKLSLSEYIVSMEVAGSNKVNVDELIPAEGVSVLSTDNNAIQMYTTVDIDEDINYDKSIDLTKNLKAKVKVTVTNLKLDYEVNTKSKSASAVVTGDATIDFGLSTDLTDLAGIEHSITVGYLPFAGGLGYVKVSVKYKINGNINVATTGDITLGVSYSNSNFRVENSFKKKTFSAVWEVYTDIGLNVDAGVDLEVLNAFLSLDAGVRATARSEHFNDDKSPSNCADLKAWLYAEFTASASIDFIGLKKDFDRTFPIYDANNSPVRIHTHYEDGVEVSCCTRDDSESYYSNYLSRYGYGAVPNASSKGVDANGETFVRFEYILDEDNKATITEYYGNSSAISIPRSLDGYEVVGIDSWVFEGRTNIRSVTIPNSVTKIGARAFSKCTNLSSVNLPDNIQSIGGSAFSGCTSLESIYIPKSLTDCGWDIFEDCDKLNDITFEEGITKIPFNLFQGCTGLTEIIIPDTVTWIGGSAFSDCCNLVSVIIPDSVIEMESSVFSDCTKLSNVVMSNDVQRIESYTFSGCTSLESIYIPKSLTDCGWGIFQDCDNLNNVTFEEGITKIPDYLFQECTGLTEITIPDTVTQIGYSAFDECTNLKVVNIPDSVIEIDSCAFSYCKALESIVIPDNVKRINSSAFAYCSNLSDVKLSKDLEFLGLCAFEKCTSLKQILIPKKLDETVDGGTYSHGTGPFKDCEHLTDVQFEEGTTQVAHHLFGGCTGLVSIEIPETVKVIEEIAFTECPNLKTVILNEGLVEIGSSAFSNCEELEEISIPKSVTTIDDGAFRNCTSLKGFTFSENLLNLGDSVFDECSSLEKVEFKNPYTIIGDYAFAECTKLKEVILPAQLKEIGIQTFYNCTSLTNITIPETVTEIGNQSFRNCDSINKLDLPLALEEIAWGAFYDCDGLTEIAIPDNVTELRSSAFYGCDNLSDVDFGIGIKRIPDSAFRLCPALETIYLPRFLETIDSNAFAENTSLKEITVPATVTSIKTDSFSYHEDMIFYGLRGSYVETYATDNDGLFVDISDIKVDSISFDNKNYVYYIDGGEERVPDITILPKDSVEPIEFTISGDDIAIVDNGVLSIYGYGTITLTATTESGKTTSCTVTINQETTGVTLDETSITLKQGETATLCATVIPEDAVNQKVTWSSSDETVATVVDGVVTGVGIGSAVIKVQTEKGGYVATCEVVVNSAITTVTEVSIKTKPTKITYVIGEVLDTTGLKLLVKYSDGTAKLVSTGFTTNGFDSTTIGTKTITVNYGGVTTSFTVEVVEGTHTHILGDWEIVEEATCTNPGTKIKKCSGCGDVLQTAEIPATGHNHNPIVTAPTCTTRGYTTYTCDCGDTYIDDYVDATGEHQYSPRKGNDPTCTEDGFVEYCCDVCESSKYTETLPATGHNFVDGFCEKCGEMESSVPDVPECNYTFSIQEPSMTTIRHKDGIKLHAKVDGTAPKGSYIEWTASNGNFKTEEINNGDSLQIISDKNGYTTITATLYDAGGNELARDTIEMRSKAGFFDKIGSFFRSLFAGTKIYEN